MISVAGMPAGAPGQSTVFRTLHQISNTEAAKRPAVQFEATVTYYRDFDIDLFVQDGETAIYVSFRAGAHLLQGDRVLVRGRMQESFRPIVVADDITVLRHGSLPDPISVSAKELFSAERDCQLASIRGTVRSAQMVWSAGRRNIYLKILIDGGSIDAAVNSDNESATSRLLDSEVEVTGIVTSEFDQKMQLSGTRFDVQSLSDVKILKPASGTPESLPVTPMEDVLRGYHVQDLSERVQVKGTITYYQPRRAVVLQSGAQSLWIVTQTDVPLKLGDIAYASGFPNVRNGYLTLVDGEIRDAHEPAPIAPQFLNWDQIGFGGSAFDLVSAEGELVMEAREAAQDEFLLTSHGHLFSAIYRHPRGMSDSDLPPLKQVQPGSQVRVSGINMFYNSDPFDGPVESNLLLRSFDDIAVVGRPSLVSVQNLTLVAGLLLVLVFSVGTRAWITERRVRRQNATSAYAEHRRSRILEDINGSRPLTEILEQITELVSFKLGGAACWCQIFDGAQLGNRSEKLSSFRIIGQQIPSRSGSPLGRIHASFDPAAKPLADESEVMLMAAGLATLAIETRRLYSDLQRRSEFDLLTDTRNRFSLERYLDEQMIQSRLNAGILGLIYVDLDRFKQVNDLYGHKVGDLYLQEVALRMTRQLRADDMLARLGGDEFAVLLPKVRNRAEVEEIAHRLEHCLDGPFTGEGYAVQGSASIGIALYPEDGLTGDNLLSASDAAMYVNKRTRHEGSDASDGSHHGLPGNLYQ